jgi:ribosomal protein S8
MLFSSGLALIKQAVLQKKLYVAVPYCNKIYYVIKLLFKYGFLYSYFIKNNKIEIYFASYKSEYLLHKLLIYYKPTKMTSLSYKNLKKAVYHKNRFFILSTELGICTSNKALQNKLGGNIIIEILRF